MEANAAAQTANISAELKPRQPLTLNEIEKIHAQEMSSEAVRHYLRTGDLALMPEDEKDRVLLKMCTHFGLDPIMRPFILIPLNGKEQWYMTKAATDQVAAKLELSRKITKEEVHWDRMYARFTAEVTDGHRVEEATAYISLCRFEKVQGQQPKAVPMFGDDLCNALMKCQSKAFRRATLAFIGGPLIVGEEDAIDAQVVQGQVLSSAIPALPDAQENLAEGELADVSNTVAGAPGEAPRRRRRTRAEIDAEKLGQPASTPVAERVADANVLTPEQSAAVDAAVAAVVATMPPAPAPQPAAHQVEVAVAAAYDPNIAEMKTMFAEIVQSPADRGGYGLAIADNVQMVREINKAAFEAKVPATRESLRVFIGTAIAEYGKKNPADIF
jgi:hypothetical protein